MAVKPDAILINFTPADGNYPYGSGKDETAPAALDGSEYKKIRADDVFGMQQALLVQAGIIPSGTADTAVASQYLQSLLHLTLQGSTFVDSGAANAYLLTSSTANHQPAAYKDGQRYIFKVNVTNTGGAATVNVSALGAKAIKILGADLVAGDLTAGRYVMLIYDLGLGRFDLIPLDLLMTATTTRRGGVEFATDAETQAGAVTNRVVSPASLESKTATTTRKGIAEIATTAEAQAGVSGVLIMTPQNLQQVTATEIRKGIAEIATQAETNNGTDDTRMVTPEKLAAYPGGSKASVNFDAFSGTPSINASANVSSITDNGVGDYTINFTTPFPDANYNLASWGRDSSTIADSFISADAGDIKTVSAMRVRTSNSAGNPDDLPEIALIFFNN